MKKYFQFHFVCFMILFFSFSYFIFSFCFIIYNENVDRLLDLIFSMLLRSVGHHNLRYNLLF